VGVDSRNTGILDIGIFYHISLSRFFSIRPTAQFEYGNNEMIYRARGATGQSIIVTQFKVSNSAVNVNLPLLIKFSDQRIAPYFTASPGICFILTQSSDQLPLRKTLFTAGAGFGMDFKMKKTGFILSPELKYSAGLTDMKDASSTTASSVALSSLKKQTYTLCIYLRKQ
jgi:hypothetical protein